MLLISFRHIQKEEQPSILLAFRNASLYDSASNKFLISNGDKVAAVDRLGKTLVLDENEAVIIVLPERIENADGKPCLKRPNIASKSLLQKLEARET